MTWTVSSTSTQPEDRRADDDPGEDLEYHRGQPQARGEPEHEGRGESERDDDQQIREAGLGHLAPESGGIRFRYTRHYV